MLSHMGIIMCIRNAQNVTQNSWESHMFVGSSLQLQSIKMGKIWIIFIIGILISSETYGKAMPQNSLLNLFGLAGNNNGGWNPLSLLKFADEANKNSADQAKHFASIANGISGLLQDAAKNVDQFGQLLNTTQAPPTSPKDPLIAGLEMLSGMFVKKNFNGEDLKN
ncbi:Hypothetical predicted protein [Cloeon dipterum]|uniref:Uncharacterized protein n=1 Tax=Cloeon dipterum TaxID=197152 RepID=A0A8S1DYW9_9INSE|nr:Hypothetical predicted protein [Cloeon dipterum]